MTKELKPFLKFVSRRVKMPEQRHILHVMRAEGFQYNGSLPSVRGEYWAFSPIDCQPETKADQDKL